MEWRCNFSKTESFQSIEDRLDRPLKKQSNQNGAHEVDCKTVRILRIQERASSQTKGLEWGWKQRARLGRDAKKYVFFLSPHTPYGRVRLARFARVRLLRHALPISFTDFEKKTDCFAVYPWGDVDHQAFIPRCNADFKNAGGTGYSFLYMMSTARRNARQGWRPSPEVWWGAGLEPTWAFLT